MHCLHCSNTQGITVEIAEDYLSVYIRCPECAGTHLHKHRGKWETAAERMERMKQVFKCADCGKDSFVYDEKFHDARLYCDRCAFIRQQHCNRASKDEKRKKNLNSPWRLFKSGKDTEIRPIGRREG